MGYKLNKSNRWLFFVFLIFTTSEALTQQSASITPKTFFGTWSMEDCDPTIGICMGFEMVVQKYEREDGIVAIYRSTSRHPNRFLNLGIKLFFDEGTLFFHNLQFNGPVAKASSVVAGIPLDAEGKLTIDPKNHNRIYVSFKHKILGEWDRALYRVR